MKMVDYTPQEIYTLVATLAMYRKLPKAEAIARIRRGLILHEGIDESMTDLECIEMMQKFIDHARTVLIPRHNHWLIEDSNEVLARCRGE